MHKDARKMLHAVDKFLARGDQASREFEAVITALRAYDVPLHFTDTDKLKEGLTVPIRRKAFPLCAKKSIPDTLLVLGSPFINMSFEGRTRVSAKALPDAEKVSRHYASHCRRAARVLGLLR